MFTNSTILNPLFWMILGALNLIFIISLRYWFQDLQIRVSKIQWAALIVYWAILNITIAGGFTLIGENETKAGMRFLAFFSIPILLSGAVIARWILKGRIKT